MSICLRASLPAGTRNQGYKMVALTGEYVLLLESDIQYNITATSVKEAVVRILRQSDNKPQVAASESVHA